MESMGPILFVAVANFQSVMQLESRVDMQPSVVFTVPIKTTKAARVTRTSGYFVSSKTTSLVNGLGVKSQSNVRDTVYTKTEIPPPNHSFSEMVWMIALCALNRAWAYDKASITEDTKPELLAPIPKPEPEEEEKLDKIAEAEEEEEEETADIEEVVEDEVKTTSQKAFEAYDAATPEQRQTEYEWMVRNNAKAMPSIAVQGVQVALAKKSTSLRTGLLKQKLARKVILHGTDKMGEEVKKDAGDPRASLALADFYHIGNQFSEETSCDPIEVGSPEWKRLCRVMSFLKRNVKA